MEMKFKHYRSTIMEWQIIKLNEDEMVLGSKTKGPYWVRSYDLDGTEMSGAFFEELGEAVEYVTYEVEGNV